MSVEFNEEKDFNRAYDTSRANSSGLNGWLIKNGIAKNENGAKTISIIIAIVCFSLAFYFFNN